MAIVLIFAEQQPDGQLRKASLNALTAGAKLAQLAGAELHAVVLAKDGAALANSVKEYGVKAVHAASGPQFEHYVAELYAPALAELIGSLKADYFGAAATALGRDLLPRVAAKLKAAMATDVMGFGGSGADVTFTRPMWAGSVIAEVKLHTPVKVFTARATEFDAAAKGSAGEVKTFSPAAAVSKTKHIDFKEVKRLLKATVLSTGEVC